MSLFEDFDRNGYVVIENIFTKEFMEDIYQEVIKYVYRLFDYLKEKKLSLGIGVKEGYQEIVQRQLLRYEIKLTDLFSLFPRENNERIKMEQLLQELQSHDQLQSIITSLFPNLATEEYKIIHQSCVVSFPGTGEQSWHSDGPHVSIHEYLPCHVFNVFIPLIDILDEHGPTEIRPESQHYTNNLAKGMLLAKLKKQLRPTVKPLLQKGSVLVFDYRVLHRGCENRSNEIRPILVLTFAKSWYKDNLNFPSRSIFDSILVESDHRTEENNNHMVANTSDND